MGIQVYIDNDNVRMHWDSEARWIYVEYRRWNTTAEVHTGIVTFLEAMRVHRAPKCLSDARLRRAVQPEAQQELVDIWIPQAAALGLKQLAIVLPKSALTLTTVEGLVAAYRRHVEADIFATVEEAAAWLSAGLPAAMPLG